HDILVSFLGFETLLLYFAFIKQTNSFSAFKGLFSAVLFITMLYLYIVIITTITFSPDEIKHAPEPVLFMLRTANINILQRLDLIFLSIWVVMVASSIISYAYLGSMGISKILGVKHKLGVKIGRAHV